MIETNDTLGFGSHLSLTCSAAVIETSLWFGGHSTFGVSVSVANGGVMSCTVARMLAEPVPPLPSLTVRLMVFVPNGTVTVGATPVAAPNWPLQANDSGSPSGSEEVDPLSNTDAPEGLEH